MRRQGQIETNLLAHAVSQREVRGPHCIMRNRFTVVFGEAVHDDQSEWTVQTYARSGTSVKPSSVILGLIVKNEGIERMCIQMK